MLSFKFHVEFRGDRAAGLLPYDDTVTVNIDHGPCDPDEMKDLCETLMQAIADFYDGAEVMRQEDYDRSIDELNEFHDRMTRAELELHDQRVSGEVSRHYLMGWPI